MGVSDRDATRLARMFKKVTLMELISNKKGIMVKETLEQSASGSWERAYYITIKLHPAERINEAFGLKIENIADLMGSSFIPKLAKTMKKEYVKASVDGQSSSFQVMGINDYDTTVEDDENDLQVAKKKFRESEEYDADAYDEED